MSTLYENLISGDDTAYAISMTSGDAQTFTPLITHILTSVKLKLYRGGVSNPPGIITVGIRATSGGFPTGADIVVGTTNGNTLTENTAGEWREITFSTGVLVVAGITYSIYAWSAAINAFWRTDTNNGYPRGKQVITADGGTTWLDIGDGLHDLMFEEWGNPEGGGSGGSIYPSDAVARVSSIRHICRPGFFRMQVGVGDIGLDIDMAESSVRTALDSAMEPEYLAREKFLAAQRDAEGVIPAGLPFGERASAARLADVVSPKTAPAPATPPPEVGQLTDYAKRILETPGAKALQTRISGLKQGVEAVITPRTVDVMREQGEQASLLMELQRIQKAASATGITSYSRQVLIKRAIQLKQQLEASYRSR